MKRTLIAVALFCLLIPAAHAGTGMVGISAGQSSVETDIGGAGFDADDTGWKAFGGYNLMKYFGVEGGYTDMGSMEQSDATTDLTTNVDAFSLYARGILPLGKKVELFGKIGYVFWDAEIEMSSPVFGSGSASTSGNDLAFGAGAAFKIVEKFEIRLEYERFTIDDSTDVDFGSIGFAYRF